MQFSVRGSLRFFISGSILLLGGVSFYLTFRPAATASGLAVLGLSALSLNVATDSKLVGALPSFFHVAAFTFLSYACSQPVSQRLGAVIAAAWTATNVLFEVGQALKPTLQITALHEYFRNGTFDPLDVVASCFGGLFAFLVAGRIFKWRNQ